MTLVHRSLVWVELNFVHCVHRGDGHMIFRAELTLQHSVLSYCMSLAHIWRVNCRSTFPLLWFQELEEPVHMFLLQADFLSVIFFSWHPLSTSVCLLASGCRYSARETSFEQSIFWAPSGCSTSFLIHAQVYMSASGTRHNLSRKPGPTALNCALKDMTGCFVLVNKAEITMVKITLIKSILKHT